MDRTELREKIVELLTQLEISTAFKEGSERLAERGKVSDQILALIDEEQVRKEVGLELQLALSKEVNKVGFNEYRLSEFITNVAHKLCKGQSLSQEGE